MHDPIAPLSSYSARRRAVLRSVAGLGTGLALPALVRAQSATAPYSGEAFNAGGETLRLAMWGGTFEQALRANVIGEFERQYNCRVQYDSAFPWFPKLVAAGPTRSPYDLINMNVVDLMKTQRAGDFFVPLAELKANVPNSRDLWDFASFSGIGLTWVFTELGYAFRRDALGDGGEPKDFRDYWAPRFNGRRANFVTTNNIFVNHFLLSCAVHGSGPTDLKAGYDAYRRIKGMRVSNFSSAMTQLLNQGEAGIGLHHDGEVLAAIAGGAQLGFARWPGYSPILDQNLAVARGTSPMRQRLAYAFVNKLVSPELQRRMGELLYVQGTNRKTVVPDNLAKMGVINSPQAAAGRWVAPWTQWLEKEAEVVETVNQIYAA